MREKRPLAFGGVLVVGCGFCLVCLFVFGVACVLFPSSCVFPSPSMMTWALRPHGVRTRGKKNLTICSCSLPGRCSDFHCQSMPATRDKSHSRLHFASSTRVISAEVCPRQGQIALSPVFRALDTQISAEGCPGPGQIPISPAFRVLDTRDLRRGLPVTGTNRTVACIFAHSTHTISRWFSRTGTNRTLACISHARHARSPQRVATNRNKSHSRLHFARSTRARLGPGPSRRGFKSPLKPPSLRPPP